MLSHNADAFGAPMCECCDADDDNEGALGSKLYDYTMDTHTHVGNTTFADLCHRAHCAEWEALGQAEPRWWHFKCPCCKAVRRSMLRLRP